jgi:FixJ family two-component response regulator
MNQALKTEILDNDQFVGPDRIGAAETAFERNDIFNSLSDLERQILQQTSEGFASEAIAKSLNVTPAMIGRVPARSARNWMPRL